MPEVDTPNNGEREFETGNDEYFKSASQGNEREMKRTADVYQDLDIQAARQRQTELAQINALALQALQNSVETANMVAKQAMRHSDIAIDAQWNPVESGAGDALKGGIGVAGLRAITIDDTSLKAIGAVVAAAVADALKPRV